MAETKPEEKKEEGKKEEEEKIDFEQEEEKTKKEDSKEQDLTDEDLTTSFVAHPKVGEETGAMTVKRFFTSTNCTRTDKSGNNFSIGLRQTDGKELAYMLETERGTYTCGSWEEVGKIKSVAREFMKKNKIKGKVTGFKVNVKHVHDGGLASKNAADVAKLNDISEEEAVKRIEASKKHKKEKKCYEVTLVE